MKYRTVCIDYKPLEMADGTKHPALFKPIITFPEIGMDHIIFDKIIALFEDLPPGELDTQENDDKYLIQGERGFSSDQSIFSHLGIILKEIASSSRRYEYNTLTEKDIDALKYVRNMYSTHISSRLHNIDSLTAMFDKVLLFDPDKLKAEHVWDLLKYRLQRVWTAPLVASIFEKAVPKFIERRTMMQEIAPSIKMLKWDDWVKYPLNTLIPVEEIYARWPSMVILYAIGDLPILQFTQEEIHNEFKWTLNTDRINNQIQPPIPLPDGPIVFKSLVALQGLPKHKDISDSGHLLRWVSEEKGDQIQISGRNMASPILVKRVSETRTRIALGKPANEYKSDDQLRYFLNEHVAASDTRVFVAPLMSVMGLIETQWEDLKISMFADKAKYSCTLSPSDLLNMHETQYVRKHFRAMFFSKTSLNECVDKPKLKSIARGLHEAVSGTKGDLLKRIAPHIEQYYDAIAPVMKKIFTRYRAFQGTSQIQTDSPVKIVFYPHKLKDGKLRPILDFTKQVPYEEERIPHTGMLYNLSVHEDLFSVAAHVWLLRHLRGGIVIDPHYVNETQEIARTAETIMKGSDLGDEKRLWIVTPEIPKTNPLVIFKRMPGIWFTHED